VIDSISIANTATYGAIPEVMNGLSHFNFIFGSNATGKTTVSRVIADEGSFPMCRVIWKGGTKLQPMVYNCDFVERNFNQPTELKGVFTLGAKSIDALNRIAATKSDLDALIRKIESLNLGLHGADGTAGKKGELAALETDFKETCWAQKQKHDAKLQGAFEGFRNSAERFKDKVLQEWAANSAKVEALDILEKKAASVFGPTPAAEKSIPSVESDTLLADESNPILKKRIIGKEDVDIAAMIKKLGNSDWVREGRAFYDLNDGVCPFCQRSTDEALAKSLREYFDETFAADSKAIDDLVTNYTTDTEDRKSVV
jgi:wobble nucleotide-excising tRNase